MTIPLLMKSELNGCAEEGTLILGLKRMGIRNLVVAENDTVIIKKGVSYGPVGKPWPVVDSFTNAAEVVCRMLGFTGGTMISNYGEAGHPFSSLWGKPTFSLLVAVIPGV